MKKYAYMRRKERDFDVGDNQKPSVSSSDSELKLFENLKARLQSLKKNTMYTKRVQIFNVFDLLKHCCRRLHVSV
jgi:iron-sulfur cluster repair protein YtfE (RIC family)